MTKKDLELLKKVLEKIKNQDKDVQVCLLNVEKDLVRYENMRGQLMDQYDYDPSPY